MFLNDIAMDISNTVLSFLGNYGWYMLLFGLIFIYLYQYSLKSYIEEFKKIRDQKQYAAKYHKNPDLFVARQVAQQEAAMKLQEKYRRDAEEYKRKMEEKEARKREAVIKKFEGKGGQKLGSGRSQVDSFRPEYNPLTGSGSGSNYRPPRRSACSRGGCG